MQLTNPDGAVANERWVDPSPVLDSNGTPGAIVLFYLASGASGDPASCPEGASSCVKTFRSATEVMGSDGTKFTVDSGDRASVTLYPTATPSLRVASDPDVFADASGFVLYLSRGQSVQALTATDLRGCHANASGLTDGLLIDKTGKVPAGHYFSGPKTEYWTFVTQSRLGGEDVIALASHPYLSKTPEPDDYVTIVRGADVPSPLVTRAVSSPGFALNDGRTPTPGPAATPCVPTSTPTPTATPSPTATP